MVFFWWHRYFVSSYATYLPVLVRPEQTKPPGLFLDYLCAIICLSTRMNQCLRCYVYFLFQYISVCDNSIPVVLV